VVGVEARQVGDAVEVGRLVDGNDLDALAQGRLVQGAQEAAADAAEAVDGDTQ
jgi:hypothetical protein